MAGRQHRLQRRLVPGAGGGRRHAAGPVRLRQRGLGHPERRTADLPGRATDQRLRGAPRRRHGPADARRRLRLHRLDADLAALRVVHLHLLRARGGRDGLCARARVRHPAGLGLPDLRAGGDPVRDAWHCRDQPLPGLDPGALAAADAAALWRSLDARTWCMGRHHALRRGIWPGPRLRLAPVWCRPDRGRGADHANGRTGRLPALHAAAAAGSASALVAGGAGRRAGLGAAGRAQDAGRRGAGLAGAVEHGVGRTRGRSEPDVSDGLGNAAALPLGGLGHRAVRRAVAAQDQCHQRLCRLAGLEQLLLAPDAQPPGPGGLGAVQCRDRADADGDGPVPGARRCARALCQPGDRLDHDGGGRPGDQQAAGLVAARHRVPARLSVRHQSGRRRRDAAGLAAVDQRPPGPVRPDRPGLLGPGRDGDRADRLAADRLGHAGPLLPGARARGRRRPGRRQRGRLCRLGLFRLGLRRFSLRWGWQRTAESGGAQAGALRGLRARVRGARQRLLSGLPGPDLLAVLHARRTLRRPLQAARQPGGAMDRGAALADAAPLLAASGRRTGALPAADAGGRVAAGRSAGPALPPGMERSGRAAGHARLAGRAAAGAARRLCQGLCRAAAGVRDRGLVAGADAQEPRRRPAGVEPPDRPAAARDRVAPPHRLAAAAGTPGRRGGAGPGRPGQSGQDALHQQHQPRAAHAAQQHPGLCPAAAAGRRARPATRARDPRHPARRRASVVADRGHARHRAHRVRQARAAAGSGRPARAAAGGGADVRAAGRGQGPALRLRRPRALAGRSAQRRAAAAPDPDQPAGQRGQVHQPGRSPADAALCTPDGDLRDRRHRPRHRAGRAGAGVRAVRARSERGDCQRARLGPGPDDRTHAGRADGWRAQRAKRGRPRHHLPAAPVPARAACPAGRRRAGDRPGADPGWRRRRV